MVRHRKKFLEIVMFLILIRWFLSFLLKNGVEVIVFVSLSVRLFQRRGSREDMANLVDLKYISGSMKLPCWVMMMYYYLKLFLKRFWHCVIFNS